MPTITIKLDEDADYAVEVYKAVNKYKTKQEAINAMLIEFNKNVQKNKGDKDGNTRGSGRG